MRSNLYRLLAVAATFALSASAHAITSDGLLRVPEPGVLELAGIAAVVAILVKRTSRRK